MLGAPLLLAGPIGLWTRSEPRQTRPAERIVSLGFEDVLAGVARIAQLAGRLDEVAATGVTLGVGRPDWTAFPWPELRAAESPQVRRTGRDFVAEAMAALGTDSTGHARTMGLVVDVLAPRMVRDDPRLAGIDVHGTPSEDFAGLAATTGGPIADRLLAMVGQLARRYRPASISFTELFFDDATFGPDDLHSYRSYSGRADWPRDANADPAVSDPTVASWRSAAVSSLVSRARDVAHRDDVSFDIDVRVSWTDPAQGRPESGHDYDLLLDAADRLVLWDYFALNDRPAGYSYDVAAAADARAPGRVVVSVGLWDNDPGGAVPPGQLAQALNAAARGGARAVAVTPTRLMSPDHWAALRETWAP